MQINTIKDTLIGLEKKEFSSKKINWKYKTNKLINLINAYFYKTK